MRAFRMAYDGRPYHGFQRQPDVTTIEDAILGALRELGVLPTDADADVPSGYAAAGRTDAGTSALSQTVAFEAPEWLYPAALNAELPASVRAWASADVPREFHATHDAASRAYVYYLHAPGADDELARAVMDRLDGEHDFHNLTPDDAGTVRTLSTACERDGPFLVLRARAGGFPRHLVRRIAGLVDEVAHGHRPLDDLDRVLGEAPIQGPAGVPTAPAPPLVLTDVEYPGVSFDADETAAADASERFAGQRVEALTGARVAGRIADGVGTDR